MTTKFDQTIMDVQEALSTLQISSNQTPQEVANFIREQANVLNNLADALTLGD